MVVLWEKLILQNNSSHVLFFRHHLPKQPITADKEQPKLVEFTSFYIFAVSHPQGYYRRYARLFFSICVDITDNELAYLESIHLFVEILDHFFSNVCELDLVFNFHKVYFILDEFILAGELQETSKRAIIERMGELEGQE
ncbi:hypothetical protein AMTRI_Chr09g17480 [Amborella trichopoda]